MMNRTIAVKQAYSHQRISGYWYASVAGDLIDVRWKSVRALR